MENINYPAPKQEYKVLVRCFTFNHSKYIEDALNGFALQQTNFPFVCLVVDDASTDGEQAVIKAWMERECDMSRDETINIPTSVITIVPHKSNTSCIFAFYLLKQNLYKAKEEKKKHVDPWRESCKYEALCEGDDYWTDPYKLQKQVDILENNPQIGLCYTKAQIYYQNKNILKEGFSVPYKGFKNLLISNPIMTLTTLYKIDLYKSYLNEIKPQNQNWLMGDYPLWLYIAAKSDIYFIPENTAVYRYSENSASHSSDLIKQERFNQNIIEIKRYFRNLFLPNIDLEKEWNDNFYRRNFRNGLDINNRMYCLESLKKLLSKTAKDKLKIFLLKTEFGFNLYKRIISLRNK